MSEQLQLRRGTRSQVASFTGAQGEVVVDTTSNRLVLQDGATAGGYAAGIERRTAVSDAAYTGLATDRIVAMTALTAARVVTLPAANAFPIGARLLVVDESGVCSPPNIITVAAAGTDTINTQASVVINVPSGFVEVESNGSNAWTIVGSFIAALAPNGAAIRFAVLEFLTGTITGSTFTCPVQIPANCILFSVGLRITTTITGSGVASFQVGDAGQTSADAGASVSRWGAIGSLTAGTTNYGLIAPTPIYGVVNIVLTPNSGSFSGGAARFSIHLAYLPMSAS